MANWPNEPAAPTMPTATLRFSGGKARATTAITTPKPVQERPSPTSSPAARLKPSGVVEYAIATSPAP